MAIVAGAGAAALATLGFAPAAKADSYYDPYYAPQDYYQERHEAQHDTNRNGRLDPWEHESLHRHEQETTRPTYREYRRYPDYRPYGEYRPYRRHPRARVVWRWSWPW